MKDASSFVNSIENQITFQKGKIIAIHLESNSLIESDVG